MTLFTKATNFQKFKHRINSMLHSSDKENVNNVRRSTNLPQSEYVADKYSTEMEKRIPFGMVKDFEYILDSTTDVDYSRLNTDNDRNKMFEPKESDFKIRQTSGCDSMSINSSPSFQLNEELKNDDKEDRCLAGSNNGMRGRKENKRDLFPLIDTRQFDRRSSMFISLSPSNMNS